MRLSVALLTACFVLVAAGRVSARCGDDPGDGAAIALARAQVDADCDCAGAVTHGAYVSCAANVARQRVEHGMLRSQCKGAVKRCAARSTCGKPGKVACCRVTATGGTRCSVRTADSCTSGGGCVGAFRSCCDACGAGGCVTTTSTSTTTSTTSQPVVATRCCGGVFALCSDLPEQTAATLCIGGPTLAPPGTVCDGLTGTCQTARAGVSKCCDTPLACFEGPDPLLSPHCALSGGTEVPGAACLASGTCGPP